MCKQKRAKPIIEDALANVLQGDALENALKLIAYLRENKINPAWSATNVWKISYRSFSVCFLVCGLTLYLLYFCLKLNVKYKRSQEEIKQLKHQPYCKYLEKLILVFVDR